MSKAPSVFFGVANLFVAAILAIAVFRGLPTRWWLVDSGASFAVLLLAASGAALLANARIAPRLARVASLVVLVLGLALVFALAITAAWLSGTYGSVGRGGAAIFGLVALLVVPYVVALPVAELLWLGPRAKPSS